MNLETCLKDHPVAKAPRSFIEALHRDIRSGFLKPGDSLGNECDLAGKYEVSRTTVRTALKLLEEQKLLRVVPRRGVFLNDVKPKSATEKMTRSYTLIRYCDDTLAQEISGGMLDFFRENNLPLNVVDANLNTDLYADILNHAAAGTSIALMPFETPAIMDAMTHAITRGIRLVQLDCTVEQFKLPGVVFDNFAGGLIATRHLLQQHNLPVWYLGYDYPSSAAKRFAGWRNAMMDFGHFDFEQYIMPGIADGKWAQNYPQQAFIENPKQIAKFLATRKSKITVIFAQNDYLSRMTYLAAETLGMKIRQDIFIAGFDNLDLCTQLSPALTSIAVPRRQLGYEAGKLLAAPTVSSVCKILPVELVIRESSLCR